MTRDQRIWDAIYAAAWAGLNVRHDDPRETLTNEQLAQIASDARSIADRGVSELKCVGCMGAGVVVASDQHESLDWNWRTVFPVCCPNCEGTGWTP